MKQISRLSCEGFQEHPFTLAYIIELLARFCAVYIQLHFHVERLPKTTPPSPNSIYIKSRPPPVEGFTIIGCPFIQHLLPPLPAADFH